MRSRKLLCLVALAMFAAVPTALASTKWYVDGVNGSDGNDCMSPQTACKTIGHAIALASSGDSIRVAPATYKETLSIGINLKVIGSSAATTIIDGGRLRQVVFISTASANVTLSRLTIRNGRSSNNGGGIFNYGTLTVNKSTISENVVSHQCSDNCSVAGGGGIANYGTLTINNSTISGNSVLNSCPSKCAAYGGGISHFGDGLSINNSTISGNSASLTCHIGCFAIGGGIGGGGGRIVINNSTFVGNSATSGGGGIGGIGMSATLQNSIVADNSRGNCDGTMISNGYNLSSDGTCNFAGPGDMNNIDPKLGFLGNHGGPTQTIPLLSGSPAIDAGNPGGCTNSQGHLLKTDQRGKPRPDPEDTGGCDMGAYERQKD